MMHWAFRFYLHYIDEGYLELSLVLFAWDIPAAVVTYDSLHWLYTWMFDIFIESYV